MKLYYYISKYIKLLCQSKTVKALLINFVGTVYFIATTAPLTQLQLSPKIQVWKVYKIFSIPTAQLQWNNYSGK